MSIFENLKDKMKNYAANIKLPIGQGKEDSNLTLKDAINVGEVITSKTGEVISAVSEIKNNGGNVQEAFSVENENVEMQNTESFMTAVEQPFVSSTTMEQGIVSAIASQAISNPAIAETMADRPDLAIITGFQEVCRVLNNPKYLDTIRGIVNDETDMVKSVSHDVKETTINVSHDARDVALKRSDNFKDVALKGFDTYQTCYTSTLTTQLEALKSSENYMLSAETEQNRHEEFMLLQQKEMFEKMLEASTHRFDSKVDFIRNQQQSLDEFYKKDVDLLTEHIQVLEAERNKNMDNTKVYMRLSDDISKLEDSKLEMKREYRKASNQLTDTIKTLEIQMKYELPSHGNNFLGTKF
ncbi:MAG: hypothetical protein SPI86_01670 [Treponemataceae bacterium]|nr:hypothetical protein [Spirochaetales bacterium]MDY6030448.1 hypothetical protein [Treponemataceae bacterium]